MTDRHTVDSINSDQLDQLYDDLERAEATLAAINAEAARRGTISIDGIRKIVKEQQP